MKRQKLLERVNTCFKDYDLVQWMIQIVLGSYFKWHDVITNNYILIICATLLPILLSHAIGIYLTKKSSAVTLI